MVALVAALVASMLSAPTASAAGTAMVAGSVTNELSGAPIEGISVRIHADGLGWFARTWTTADGTYAFAGLDAGTYHLRFDDPLGGVFEREFFDDQPTLAAATPVVVTAATTTTADAAVAGGTTAPPPISGRDLDPVVMAGADLSPLQGVEPDDIVGFAWDGASWEQVAVQVDERHVADLKQLRDGSGTMGTTVLAYSDPSSNAGADPTATFDGDDELVVLAGDLGTRAPGAATDPAGVTPGSRVDVEVTDPTVPGTAGHLSLFTSTTLDPAAGVDLVSYSFSPVGGGGAESSTVQTERYRTRFVARWVRDLVEIEAPYGTGVDILDRHRNLFAPGYCGRSEDTFSSGDGGFATNVDGPLRAIRSYLGANSGTYTQRQHLFYPAHEVTTTFLRVHTIPGILDLWDYSPDAGGMTYTHSGHAGTVTIDGTPDAVTAALLDWERLDGAQGGLIHTYGFDTTLGPSQVTVTSYYRDDSTPPDTQCTGDAYELGASGPWLASEIPNTDPANPPYESLAATRTTSYVASGTTAAVVDDVVAGVHQPLVGTLAP